MFFGKRRRRKGSAPDPESEPFDDEDFGFEEVSEESSVPDDRPARIEREPPPDPIPEAGRPLDQATVVEGPPPDAELHGGEADLEAGSDVTRFIGPPVDPRVTTVAWLVAVTGAARGRDYRLPDGVTRVGTAAECHIRLPREQYVSTSHAELRVREGEYVLRDLNSTNGTFRNEERITEVVLRDDDRVRFGLSTFVFKSVRL
jgi:hypothetical protein